jgi:large subunit ribosomal protein L30
MPRTFVWHPTRGPKTTPKDEPAGKGKVQIKQVRSGIGHPARLRRTLEAIGLHHHQDVVVKQDSASLRGQIRLVRHLVTVSPVKE